MSLLINFSLFDIITLIRKIGFRISINIGGIGVNAKIYNNIFILLFFYANYGGGIINR